MRLSRFPALLLSLLPHLGWGSPLTTTLYRVVTEPTDPQLQAIYTGLRGCTGAQMLPRPIFGPLGLPYHGNTPRLASGQPYRLHHPVWMGQRLLLTEVTRDGTAYRLRFNKSLSVYAHQLPPALQAIVTQADAGGTPQAFTLSDDGRVLTCLGAGA